MNKTVPLIAGVVVCLSACSTSTGSGFLEPINFYEMESATLKRLEGMQVLPPVAALLNGYTELGTVEGSYCQKEEDNYSRANSREGLQAAQDQVKMRAAMMGADAILMPQCRPIGPGRNKSGCYSSMSCRSTAFTRAITAI